MMQRDSISRSTFAAAYHDGLRRTIGFLLSRGASPDDAEDLAQAAWVRGWERRHQLRSARCLVSWVNSISLNMLRSSRTGPRISEATSDSTFGVVTIDTAAIDVEKLLTFCRRGDRRLLRNYYLEGRSTGELARVLGVGSPTVRVRLFRARQFLRSLLSVAETPGPEQLRPAA